LNIKKISQNKCFNGLQQRYSHQAETLNCSMNFSIYLPPQVTNNCKVPVLYWLSGLTCTDENFMQKAGAQRIAAELGMALVAPDTSPRGDHVVDAEDKAYDLGLGAGFYLNATQVPWQSNYQMYAYILQELPRVVEANFPVLHKRSIAGHSMGGHGALILALNNPSHYCSVSAFSPISNPMNSPWGQKAFTNYLGGNKDTWGQYDASELIKIAKVKLPMLVEQGENDEFLTDELMPESLIAAAKENDYPLELRYQQGYDHSYYFIASFIELHLRFHADCLFNG
jgi:S-formylglutathione hydrolase